WWPWAELPMLSWDFFCALAIFLTPFLRMLGVRGLLVVAWYIVVPSINHLDLFFWSRIVLAVVDLLLLFNPIFLPLLKIQLNPNKLFFLCSYC
ncbi:hypothetical protein COCCADRAFT_83468, partial [Bipolaris zeicola 26-R-13]